MLPPAGPCILYIWVTKKVKINNLTASRVASSGSAYLNTQSWDYFLSFLPLCSGDCQCHQPTSPSLPVWWQPIQISKHSSAVFWCCSGQVSVTCQLLVCIRPANLGHKFITLCVCIFVLLRVGTVYVWVSALCVLWKCIMQPGQPGGCELVRDKIITNTPHTLSRHQPYLHYSTLPPRTTSDLLIVQRGEVSDTRTDTQELQIKLSSSNFVQDWLTGYNIPWAKYM